MRGITPYLYCLKEPETPGCKPNVPVPPIADGRPPIADGGRPPIADGVWTRPPVTEPPICCMAMTAECLACAEGISPYEYCIKHPKTAGCKSYLDFRIEPTHEAHCRDEFPYSVTCIFPSGGETSGFGGTGVAPCNYGGIFRNWEEIEAAYHAHAPNELLGCAHQYEFPASVRALRPHGPPSYA